MTLHGSSERELRGLLPPIFGELSSARSVLIAGAGGGFDVFSGLPLYFALRNAGKTVHLANLTFAEHEWAGSRLLSEALFVTDADVPPRASYAPEVHLARFLRAEGLGNVPIYCLARTGVKPLVEAYGVLAERLDLDAVVLVDGGTDSLMRGDEPGLGTPEEDIASILAVDALDVPTKVLACLGFGVDAFHGVFHAYVLEAVADLTRAGALLGVFALQREMPEVELYTKAVLAVHDAMPKDPSIVSSSIVSALEGRFGDYHKTKRTQDSVLFINPLMALYWCFRLGPVAARILYREEVRSTASRYDLSLAIEQFRDGLREKKKPWDLPM
ncbi:DUF1152 domain-containing protein [bacterium]|nr:DUF1152 domain-containing protein [bacterium]